MSELARWEERYRTGDTPWDTGEPSSELQRVIAEEHIRPCRTVELGCGSGTNAVWLAQQGFQVTAVDLSPLAIRRAEARAAAEGATVRFVCADVLHLPDLGDFDFFFDRGCYHVVRRVDVQSYQRTLSQISHPGTLGLVLAGNAREPHEPGPPVVDEREIREELGAIFEIQWLREFRFDQVEAVGIRFLGWSCFLQRPAENGTVMLA
jgi:SAM-dependent methyltransferase